MTRRPCRPLAEDRSALVDGSLPPARRERLLVHLVHCTPCRDDVAELRRLRESLRRRTSSEAPHDLAQRLVLIAGAEARAPLWCRPFRRTRRGTLTSRRRVRRLRAAAALAVGTSVVGAGALGWVAAPAAALTPVADPAVRAQADLGATLAQLPLVDPAVGAVVSADPADLTGRAPVGGRAPAVTGSRTIDAVTAAGVLRRALRAVDQVGYRGVQDVRSRSAAGTVAATVLVRAVPGQGSTAEVLDADGDAVASSTTPAPGPGRLPDDSAVDLLASHHRLEGWSDGQAAGRPAAVVQATRADGTPAARWWVDEATGLLLAQQTFDADGGPLVAAGFAVVEVDPPAAELAPLPQRAGVVAASTTLTLSNAPALAQEGWSCDERLAGLALVRLRSDGAAEPGAVHLVYSDGVSTVSVHEQRGALATGPDGSSWDTTLGAWTRTGPASLASWQSGDRVFTVATDGPSTLLAAAVASLPHEPSQERTTMGRIREGWGTLLADMKG
ncbi:hypothetical protein SAMN04488543_0876 [Friedmanniella luteola]|uniref:Putative zinc-finger domain-containing protein n=1 Tax=Friedmanniella luteola TaxID=546871 RepID=A0A1H1NJ76_9ACTN|nr:hypothetical protein [Friedmanniella luteola]SDR98933.1 hypothetical protein SAMN04488543_0876 [Friedmanniella luteola]